MNKAIIFDWSGTLSDNFDLFHKIYNSILEELGKSKISKEELKANFTIPYMKFWDKYAPEISYEEENKLYSKYIIKQSGNFKVFKGVKETIKCLYDQGWNLFVISSDLKITLIPELKKADISKYFQKVIGEIHIKNKAITKLVNEFNLDKNNTYYVGDTSGDIEEGKKSGIKTIGISWGYNTREKLSKFKSNFLIDNIIELKEILKNAQ